MKENIRISNQVKVPTRLVSGTTDYSSEVSTINIVHRYPGDTAEKSRIAFQNGLMRYT